MSENDLFIYSRADENVQHLDFNLSSETALMSADCVSHLICLFKYDQGSFLPLRLYTVQSLLCIIIKRKR